MRWTVLVAALLLIPCIGAQDEGKIRDLIDRLGDDDPKARDEAQRDLVRIGPAALPALKAAIEQTSDVEIKNRCLAAVREIERNERLSKVYREPHRATLRFENARLADILAGFETEYQVRILGPRASDARVSLQVIDGTLLQALDTLCRELKTVSYKIDDRGITFTDSKFVPCPVSYAGPFRVRISRIARRVTDTFEKKTADLEIRMVADWEGSVKPLEGYSLELLEIVDGDGNRIKPAEDPNRNLPQQILMERIRRPQTPTEVTFSYPGLDPAIRRLKRIEVKGTFRFPLDVREVRFEDPKNGQEQEVGGFKIRLNNVDRSYLLMNISAAGGSLERLYDLLDDQSFVATDRDGNEHKCTLTPAGHLDARTLQYYVMMPGQARSKGLKAVKFNLREVHEKYFEFEFADIDLP